MNWRGFGTLFVVLALIGGACSSGDAETSVGGAQVAGGETVGGNDGSGNDDTTGGEGGDEPERIVVSATEGREEGDDARWPLADFLGFDPNASGADTEARIQDEIVSCMAAEGFEYTPSNASIVGMLTAGRPDDGGPTPGSEAWVDRYGFGISTLAFHQDDVGPNLVGRTWELNLGGNGEDPNREYVAGLSPADQTAYYEALYGLSTDMLGGIDPTAEDADLDALSNLAASVGEGCEAQAAKAATGGLDMFALFTQFGGELMAMTAAIDSDPRMIEKGRQVAECLANQGLASTSTAEVQTSFREQVSPIRAAALVTDVEDLSLEDLQSASMGDLQDMFLGAELEYELTDEHKAELARIQAEEIALAKTFTDCGSGINGLVNTPVYNQVRAEVEDRFLEENLDRLTAFRDGQ